MISPPYPPSLKARVANRGAAPDSFLGELILWARNVEEEVYAANANPADIFALIRPALCGEKGQWRSLAHRRAALCEAMRVHAGFESSWNWQEGVDTTNRHSQTHIEGQETGIFQVSFDSTALGGSAMLPYARKWGVSKPEAFIPAMQCDHHLALDFYARLVRVSIAWAGPLKRGEILPYLSREAVTAFEGLI